MDPNFGMANTPKGPLLQFKLVLELKEALQAAVGGLWALRGRFPVF